MGRWGNAHVVEGLVRPVFGVVIQVDAVVLHPAEVVLTVQHLDGHCLEVAGLIRAASITDPGQVGYEGGRLL